METAKQLQVELKPVELVTQDLILSGIQTVFEACSGKIQEITDTGAAQVKTLEDEKKRLEKEKEDLDKKIEDLDTTIQQLEASAQSQSAAAKADLDKL